jgi:hypothetical protein
MSGTILKVSLFREGDVAMGICAAIQYEGEIWLVPDWIRAKGGRSAKPLRMIPISRFPHKALPKGDFADYAIDGLVPKFLFDLHLPAKKSVAFGVREKPDLTVQMLEVR